jgi:hypothetical protein
MGGSRRHALATILLITSLGGGSRVSAAGDVPPPKAVAPAAAPDAAHAARAKRRWIVEGSSFDPSLVDPVRRRVYLFDAAAHAPLAASTETGARIWTAKPPPSATASPKPASTPIDALTSDPRFLDLLPPVERKRVGQAMRLGLASAVLRRTADSLLVGEMKTLTAYDLETGALLWTRDDPCRLEEARGAFARLACTPIGSTAVITARTGKPALAIRRSASEQAVLGPHALLFFAKEAGRLSSRSLDPAGASWSITLAPGERRSPRTLFKPSSPVVVTEGAIVAMADKVTAIDPRTGKWMWRAPAPGCELEAAWGQELALLCPDHLEIRDLATGNPRDVSSLPLPPGDHGRLELVGDDRHQVLVEGPHVVGADDRLFFRGLGDKAWTTLRRPSLAVTFGWDGNAIVAAGSYDGFLSGLDPATLEPPLASLPPARAIAAIVDDAGSWDRFVAPDLITVDGLGPALTARLEHPDGPLYGEALAYLEQHPVAEALPILVRRLAKAATLGERRAILDDIAAQDSEAATQVLVDWLKDAPSGRNPLVGDRHDPLYRQIWRTGRTAASGLCAAGTRPVPELATPAPDGSIGTANPLLFQTAAPDASWVGICQARHDTNHDGSISVTLGYHGDAMGDEMQPYLVVGSGAGLPVDDFLGHDPTGRYVAVRQGACLDVIDTKERTATRLPDADLRDADRSFGPPRAVSFDADGTRMLYIKGGVPRPEIVVRDLARGTETPLDPGPGNLWRATLDPEATWVTTETVAGSHWPFVATSLAPRLCRGEAASYSSFGPERASAAPVRRVIPATGGAAQEVPGLIQPFGRDLLVREPDGALSVVAADGKRLRTLVPADCHAGVAHVDGKRGVVLVGCLRQDRGSFELYGGGNVAVLASEKIGETAPLRDRPDEGRTRFVRLADGRFVDLDSRAIVSRPALAPQETRVTDYRERRSGIYLVRGDGYELMLPGAGAAALAEVPKGPLLWRKGATDTERPPWDRSSVASRLHLTLGDAAQEAPIPVRDPRWGLMFEFGFGGGGTDLAKVPYNGSTGTLSAGDGIAFSLGLMWTPLWWGDRLGAGVSGTFGYKGIGVGDKGSEVSIGRFPLTLALHVLPRISHNWLLLARGGLDKEFGASFGGSGIPGGTIDLTAKLAPFAEGGFYYIFDIWNLPEHRGEQRAALSLTFRYTKLTYTTSGGSLDGDSLMVYSTYYYNP